MKEYKNKQTLKKDYYENEMTAKEMAEKYGCSKGTVFNWMEKFGLDRRGRSDVNEIYTKRNVLKNDYFEEMMTLEQMADKYGCSKATVIHWMDEHGLDRRDNSSLPSVRIDNNGYEYSHSYYNLERDKVYIHRLIAVAEYGIKAVQDKHIHHKNEIRWDNRPSNLDYMSPSQHARHHRLKESKAET